MGVVLKLHVSTKQVGVEASVEEALCCVAFTCQLVAELVTIVFQILCTQLCGVYSYNTDLFL